MGLTWSVISIGVKEYRFSKVLSESVVPLGRLVGMFLRLGNRLVASERGGRGGLGGPEVTDTASELWTA